MKVHADSFANLIWCLGCFKKPRKPLCLRLVSHQGMLQLFLDDHALSLITCLGSLSDTNKQFDCHIDLKLLLAEMRNWIKDMSYRIRSRHEIEIRCTESGLLFIYDGEEIQMPKIEAPLSNGLLPLPTQYTLGPKQLFLLGRELNPSKWNQAINLASLDCCQMLHLPKDLFIASKVKQWLINNMNLQWLGLGVCFDLGIYTFRSNWFTLTGRIGYE